MAKTLTKQDLKTPDEFITWGTRAALFAEKNIALVVVGALIPLVAAGGIFAVSYQRQQREVEASGKLFAGEKLLEGSSEGPIKGIRIPGMSDPKPDELKGAVASFQQVAKDFPGTRTERRAHLLAGDASMLLKDYDGAMKEYDAAVSGGTDIERYYALSGKAHALEGKSAWDDAASSYRKIVDDATALNRDIAALDLARVLAKGGKAEDAKNVLSKFATDYPNSALKTDAESKRLALGGEPAPATPATNTKPEAN